MRKLPRQNHDVIAPRGTLEPNLSAGPNGTAIIRQTRKYELITPLFGGGVEPGMNDATTPINGKSIRGQLRFWWRATRAGEFGGGQDGLRKMKECEALIWGAASSPNKPSPSAVQIEVVLSPYYKIGDPELPYERIHQPNRDWTSRIYAAFPLQDTPHSVAKYRFDLRISFPETLERSDGSAIAVKKEIDATLWAWQTFGGIGARTRRGFGALKRTDDPDPLPKEPETIERKIREGLTEHVTQGEFPSGVPHLSADMSFVLATTQRVKQVGPNKVKSSEPYNSYDDAWEALIVELKSFRQPRPVNSVRDSRSGRMVQRPGRSKWNEPERIREITKQRFTRHTKNSNLADIDAFSRAAFGQPILFQFHRDEKNTSGSSDANRDPVDTTLKGGRIPWQPDKSRERLASPLILRPLACGGTKAVGLAAILKTPRVAPEGLYLKGDGVNEKVDLKVTKGAALRIEPLKKFASALANDSDEVDVLEAFIDGFRPKEEKKK